MKNNQADRELSELRVFLALEGEGKNPHLDSELGASRYINNAETIKAYLPAGQVLDWGCGLGQMTYLLQNRDLAVTSYDIDQGGKDFLARIGQTLVLASDPVKLPFPDASFDAVLSSGVLEHVADPVASLQEVSRVLKRNGYFFVFRLPNKYSYSEFISDRLGRGDHPVKYSRREITATLQRSGYDVISSAYQGFLPYNLKGFPSLARELYHCLDRCWAVLDPLLTACPGLNLFSTNLELVARKK